MNKTFTLFLARRLPFYYGWIMLAVAMLIHICTAPGQTYGISIFNPYLREELGLSASRLGGAYMGATLLAGLPLTLVGVLMDRYGTRTALLIIVSLLGVTCVSMSRVSGIWSLFLVFFCLRFLAQGSMGLLAANTMAMWFSRRLGFASGLSNMGMAASFGLIPLLNLFLIREFGWRSTYTLLGIAVCLILLPLLLLLYRNRPEEMGLQIDGQSAPPQEDTRSSSSPPDLAASFTLQAAMRTRSFWLLVVVAFHLVPEFHGCPFRDGVDFSGTRPHSRRRGAGVLHFCRHHGHVSPLCGVPRRSRTAQSDALVRCPMHVRRRRFHWRLAPATGWHTAFQPPSLSAAVCRWRSWRPSGCATTAADTSAGSAVSSPPSVLSHRASALLPSGSRSISWGVTYRCCGGSAVFWVYWL